MVSRIGVWFVMLLALAAWGAEPLGKVAYLRDGALWVQAIPDGKPLKVAAGRFIQPRFSNSGRWLLFREWPSLKSHLVDLTSTTLHEVALAGDWSPTADELLYPGRDGYAYIASPYNPTRPRRLPIKLGGDMIWSADGRRIAYVQVDVTTREHDEPFVRTDLYIINRDGTGKRRLVHGKTVVNDTICPRAWTADGRYIIYNTGPYFGASIYADGTPLYALPVAGGKPILLSESLRLTGGTMEFALSADGTRVAAVDGSGGREMHSGKRIMVTTLSTGKRTAVTDAKLSSIDPAWSPADGRLAYVAAPSTPEYPGTEKALRQVLMQRRIVIRDLAKSAAMPLTGDNTFREEHPLWSADGRHLLFARIGAKDDAGLWAREMTKGSLQLLAAPLHHDDTAVTAWNDYYSKVYWPSYLAYWRGQRSAVPGIERGITYAPARETLAALGGTATYDRATRMLTITLNHAASRFYLDPATTIDTTRDGFFLENGVAYLPLRLLAQTYQLALTWNTTANEAVVKNLANSCILILPTRHRPAAPRAPKKAPTPPAGVSNNSHVLLRVTPDGANYVIGGLSSGRYHDGYSLQTAAHANLTVTRYTRTAKLGDATVVVTRDSANQPIYSLNEPVKADTYALASPWNALPRQPVADDPKAAPAQALAKAILAAHGMPKLAPNVTEALHCDLDGDGSQELIISATTTNERYLETPEANSYSFVAVQQSGKPLLVIGDFQPYNRPGDVWYNIYTIGACLDVDGDGRMEIIVHLAGYEWGGSSVFRMTARGSEELFAYSYP